MNSAQNVPTPQPSGMQEAEVLQALQAGLDDFELPKIGALYRAAHQLTTSEAGTDELKAVHTTILSVLSEFLDSRHFDMALAIEEEGFSIESAQRGAQVIHEMWKQYQIIKQWPSDFNPLLKMYQAFATVEIENLNNKVRESSEELRQAFREIALEFEDRLHFALISPDRAKAIAEATQVSIDIRNVFDASAEIEGVCAWRLGKNIRTVFRRLARAIEQEFGVSTPLPETVMDTAPAIRSGNRIPREWR